MKPNRNGDISVEALHCDNYLAIFLMLGLEDVLFDRRRQDSALMLMFAKFSVSFILILDQFL